MTVSFEKSDDQLAFQCYKEAIQSDKNAAAYFDDYCSGTDVPAASFTVFRSEFEKRMMKYEVRYLNEIKKCPKLYRAYRAHMREHYIRQNSPWPIAFLLFYDTYLKPKLYREFVVFNETGLKRVMDFYKWLDTEDSCTIMKSKLVSMMHNGKAMNVFELEGDIYDLYCDESMWQKMEKGGDVNKWVSTIRTNLVKLIRKQLAIIKLLPGNAAKRHYFVFEICRVLLRFHRCMTAPEFSFESFLKTFIKKCLEFSFYKGVPEGMYLLAQFYPDMICDECCPWINTKTENYSKTDVSSLLQNNSFYNLSWCHEYWSEEYHWCIY